MGRFTILQTTNVATTKQKEMKHFYFPCWF